jgi:nitroreductase
MEAIPLRDFGLTQPKLRHPIEAFEPYPTIVVLSTDRDDRENWITAGQALQRMLLLATLRGLAATPMSQLLEIAHLRKLVTDADRWAQLILCLGYAPPTTPTARRPLADVLTRRG